MEEIETAQLLRNEIRAKLTIIQLCASIMRPSKLGAQNKRVREGIIAAQEFTNSSDQMILEKGKIVLNLIEGIYQISLKNFPLKKSLYEVAIGFNDYCIGNPEYPEKGILYGWLNDHIDCKNLYTEKIPSHARVGTFYHAGKFVIEESVILRDAFFFLNLAEKELEKMEIEVNESKEELESNDDEAYQKLSIYNSNVGTYSRICLLSFYSFMEAFVNGIGLDQLYNFSIKYNSQEIEILKGFKKGSHLSLEKKMEKFHQLIRSDRKQMFILTDKNQLREPFKTFFNDCKEIRDSSVHFSALKTPIVRRPHEWIKKIDEYSRLTLDVAKEFWQACFEREKYPNYLDLLEYDILKKIAFDRVKVSS